jgi:hypothetical protein
LNLGRAEGENSSVTPVPSSQILSLYRYFAYADNMAKLYAKEMNEGWLQMLAEANEEDFFGRDGPIFFGTEEERTEIWLNELFGAFASYFKANTLPIPEPLRSSLQGLPSNEVVAAIRRYWKSREK